MTLAADVVVSQEMEGSDFYITAQEKHPANYVATDLADTIVAHGRTLGEVVAAVEAAGLSLDAVRFTYVEPPENVSCYEASRSP